jgi:psiF repeat
MKWRMGLMHTVTCIATFVGTRKRMIIGIASVLATNLVLAQAPALAAPKPTPNPSAASSPAPKSCEAQATGKKLTGAAKTTFVKKCQGATSGSKDLNKQQQKMVTCNKQAGQKSLKGDARKKFMSTCLKG